MGACSSSKVAVGPASPAQMKRQDTAHALVAAAELGAGAAASSVVGGVVSRSVAGAAGEALLGVAKELPWIAPIAFLIGSVVQAAHDAGSLKADARAFVRVVRSVEGVLEQAAVDGKLAGAAAPCALIKEALEAGLAHAQKLETQSVCVAMLLSGRDGETFAELQDQLHRACDLLALACAADTALLVRESYDQETRLAEDVEAAGGAAAVARDPALRAKIAASLSAADQVIVATVAHEVEASRYALEAKLEAKFAADAAEREKRHETMLRQLSTLTHVVGAIARMRAGGDDEKRAAMDGAAVAREVQEKMPLPAAEPARLRALDKTQLEALVGDGDLRDLVNEAREVHEADVSWIGTVGLEDQTYLATDLKGAAPGALDGVVVPRPLSQCQHVVASGEARTSMVATSPDVFAMAGPEVAAAAEAGHAGVARFLETTGAAMDPATAADARLKHAAPGGTVTAGPYRKLVQLATDDAVQYRGVPVRVHGEAVCTLCTMGKKTEDVSKLESLAARAGQLLERKAAARAAAAEVVAPAAPVVVPVAPVAPVAPEPAAAPRSARPPAVARPAAPADGDVGRWLAARRLGAFAPGFAALGVETVEDLHDVTAEDAAELGMTRVQSNRLRREAIKSLGACPVCARYGSGG